MYLVYVCIHVYVCMYVCVYIYIYKSTCMGKHVAMCCRTLQQLIAVTNSYQLLIIAISNSYQS